MAILNKIILKNWRNIAFAELEFSPGVNCICGDNGQGKTNLLDAIHYLSMTKSAFGIQDSFCSREGGDGGFSIAGTYAMPDGMVSRFVISLDSSVKTLKRDGKAIERLSSHIGVLPVVMVSPQDSDLVVDGGQLRRRFVNSVLCQLSPLYLTALQKYNRLLAQRNRLLKDYRPDPGMLDVLDDGLSRECSVIARERSEFALKLKDSVSEFYSRICGGREQTGIAYVSDVPADGLGGLLRECRERDIYLKYTSVGPQRDDFSFLMDGRPIRKCGSQGQQKSFLVALKLAQYNIMKTSCGYAPLLLLDDLFDKLDADRISNLLNVVNGEGYGQIFITDTSRERLEATVGGTAPGAAYFTASNGEF